jgi:hypothetical protein
MLRAVELYRESGHALAALRAAGERGGEADALDFLAFFLVGADGGVWP